MPRPQGTKADSHTITAELLRVLEESGMSRYEIAQRTGVEQSALSRFLTGERTMTLATADRLCAGLGIHPRLSRARRLPE